MKVKCIKILSNTIPREDLGNQALGLVVGQEYIVLTFFIRSGKAHYGLIDDEGDITAYEADQFSILSNYIPSNWEVTLRFTENNNCYFDMTPVVWNRAKFKNGLGFWSEIADADGPLENWRDYPADQIPEVVKLYLQETEIIYREEAAYEKEKQSNLAIKNNKTFNLHDFKKIK